MKIVEVPGDIVVHLRSGTGQIEDRVAFKRFLVHQMDSFEGITTREQVRQADKIVKLIESSNGSISFEDADYSLVNDACAQLRWVPEAKRQLIPFLDALEKPQAAAK